MSEVLNKVEQVHARIAELRGEWETLEKEANALEGKAREARIRMSAIKQEIREWVMSLETPQVKNKIAAELRAAADIRAEAEKVKAEYEKKLAELTKPE